jgi:hypothetical protein
MINTMIANYASTYRLRFKLKKTQIHANYLLIEFPYIVILFSLLTGFILLIRNFKTSIFQVDRIIFKFSLHYVTSQFKYVMCCCFYIVKSSQ